jgi:hypothetical protein
MWSIPYDPSDFVGSGAGYATVTSQKMLRGMKLRSGPSSSPSGLLWSADSLLQMTYVGGTPVFSFSTLSDNISVMSAASIVEMDGIYYWLGSDRFFMFNGVVADIPNTLNRDFLFENMNYAYRQKAFAFTVPRWGEVWWCFPKGDSTEPNHAVIFNTRDGGWYDTELPEGGRAAGIFPSVFRRPLMTGVEAQDSSVTTAAVNAAGTGYIVGDILTVAGGVSSVPAQLEVDTVGGSGEITAIAVANAGVYTVEPTDPVSVTGGTGSDATFNLTFGSTYKFWVHEVGVNKQDGQTEYPIQSYFQTADIALPLVQQVNRQTEVIYVEPDFVQEGDMTVQVSGQANSRAPVVTSDPQTFSDTADSADEEIVFLKEQRRLLRFRFESNTLNGNYEMGMPLAHILPGDGTFTS